MKLFARYFRIGRISPISPIGPILLLLAILLTAPLAQAGKKSTDAFSDSASKSSPTPSPPKFNVPIPISHDAEGVNLPYFDNRGRLQMYFNIAKAIRVDLYHLGLENAYMQTYDDKGDLDSTVYLTRSVLDLNTRIVTSQVPVTVRRSDFEVVGQKMVFNTQTRQGRLTGHVHMTIYNRADIGQPSPSPGPSSSGTSAAPVPSPISH